MNPITILSPLSGKISDIHLNILIYSFIRDGFSFNLGEENFTAAHYTAGRKDCRLIQILLDRGLNYKSRDNFLKLPLDYFLNDYVPSECANKKCRTINHLFSKEFDLSEVDPVSRGSYLIKSIFDVPQHMQQLINLGADIQHKDICGMDAIAHACFHGQIDQLKLLIQNGARLDVKYPYGNTLLHYSAASHQIYITEYLSKITNTPFTVLNKVGFSLLHFALEGNDFFKEYIYLRDMKFTVKICKDLIKYGAIINPKLFINQYAKKIGQYDLAIHKKYFMWNFISLPSREEPTLVHKCSFAYGENYLMYLAVNGDIEKINTLVLIFEDPEMKSFSSDLDINHQDNNGWTALHYAAYFGHYEAMEALVRLGANPNIKCHSGETANDIYLFSTRYI